MTFLKMIHDPVLLEETLLVLEDGLHKEKRWAGAPYMPEPYADTVKEHIDSTRKTFGRLLGTCPETPYIQELKTVGDHMIRMHDVPEIFGELMLGAQEQALASGAFDPYAIDARSFAFAFYHAENAVRGGTQDAFINQASAIKQQVRQEKRARIAQGADGLCMNLLGDMFHVLNAHITDVPEARNNTESNISFAQLCFETIEKEDARKRSFAGTVGKALEKNDSGTHMAAVYQAILRDQGAEQVPYRYDKNSDIIKSCYRSGAALGGVLHAFPASARDRTVQQHIARDTVRLVYETCQEYFKFGPGYIDLDNRDEASQPHVNDGAALHDAYQESLRQRYEQQDAQRPETHRVISKQDLMLRLETNKQALCVVQDKARICIDPAPDHSVFWKQYAELKHQGWAKPLPY